MSSQSNDIGRAFEYASLLELRDRIAEYRPVRIDGESATAVQHAWDSVGIEQQRDLKTAAAAFVDTLFEAEPLILECDGENDVIEIFVNKDYDGESGDVRDIVIRRGQIQWDIGLSMKHNHFAVKHSRLSATIDFGKKWYGIPCGSSYWETVHLIFDRLRVLQRQGLEWNKMTDKENTVYVPLLNAFKDELERAYRKDMLVPTRLISYLLGIRDFYKVVAIDRKRVTEFQGFNLRGELNKNGKHKKATLFIPVAELPDEIIAVKFKKNTTNTVEMYFNNGWALSFRIHNASTIIQPSLKFDIQFLGIPSSIITLNCEWR